MRATKLLKRVAVPGMAMIASVAITTSTPAAVTLNVFTDPHPVVSGGTIGFAYAGNKFVGSVQRDGTGVLYQTDLHGGNVQLFAPGVTIPGGSPSSEHFVSSSLGRGGFPSRDVYTMAEAFRDDGRDILFFVDNIYRYTLAGTEVSALLGRMTRDEVGSLLGMQLETVSRILSRFQKSSLIHVQGRHVQIVDLVRLRAMATH